MIFKTYTGNAMLNNALMTIEALAELEHVSGITPDVLMQLFNNHKLWELNPRLKNYTMLFTRNSILFNDAQLGTDTYINLFKKITNNLETSGKHQCALSGIHFETTFSDFYERVLKDLKISQKDIDEKDKTINRCWFPLIGSLGSDAQALPQAKYDVCIHPICIIIIQFLPLSAMLYKKGILLFDSIHFEFSRAFILRSVERIQDEIRLTTKQKQVENIKDFNKGKYLLKAMELFTDKQKFYDDSIADINLWSFSNSGTGASCEIDRIPSPLFKDILSFYKKPSCQVDLKAILNNSNSKISNGFINSLKNGLDFDGLYPTKNFKGVSVAFYEQYQTIIGMERQLSYAKYIAYLIKNSSLSKSDEKLLLKTDAYIQKEYIPLFQKTLLQATSRGEWSLQFHLEILDEPDSLPLTGNTYSILKKVHFYYQKESNNDSTHLESPRNLEMTLAGKITSFVIHLIQNDIKESNKEHNETLIKSGQSTVFNLEPIVVRQSHKLTLAQAVFYLFNDFKLNHYGLTYLLQMYFVQKNSPDIPEIILPPIISNAWLEKLEFFSELYAHYYTLKYNNDWKKFKKHVLIPFPQQGYGLQKWLDKAFEKMREVTSMHGMSEEQIKALEDKICFDENGEHNVKITRFAIHFCLTQQFYYKPIINH